jgi:hypothetical protein
VATRPPFCHSANPEGWCKSSLDRVTLRGAGKCPRGETLGGPLRHRPAAGTSAGAASNSSSMAGREPSLPRITCIETGWETVRFEIVIFTIVGNRVNARHCQGSDSGRTSHCCWSLRSAGMAKRMHTRHTEGYARYPCLGPQFADRTRASQRVAGRWLRRAR